MEQYVCHYPHLTINTICSTLSEDLLTHNFYNLSMPINKILNNYVYEIASLF